MTYSLSRRLSWQICAALLFAIIYSTSASIAAKAQAIITTSDTVTATFGVPDNLVLDQFDPTLGILQSIQVEVSGEISATLRYANLNQVASDTFDVFYEVTLDAAVPNNPSPPLVAGGIITDFTVTAGPWVLGTDPFTPPSGDSVYISTTITNATSILNSLDFGPYVGTGTITIPVVGDGSSGTRNGVIASSSVNTQGQITIDVIYRYLVPSISIEKSTNAIDADDPTGPLIQENDTVTWQYVVENTGSVDIPTVNVADSVFGVVPTLVSGDDGDTILETTETWIYEAIGPATLGQYMNIGSVVGAIPSYTGPLTDSDPSHYFGINPQIDIEKSTNGVDADNPTGPLIQVGDPVTWTYVISNTGNITIENVSLVDVDLPGGSTIVLVDSADGDALLGLGEQWTYQATGTATAGQYANVGTIMGEVLNVSTGPGITETIPVSATDPSHYFGFDPSIDIEKSTNGEDADTETGPLVSAGSTVTWTYEVTNTGNITLSNIGLTDSVAGVAPVLVPATDVNGDMLLSVGESWTYQTTGTAIAGQYENIGTATGQVPGSTDPNTGNPVQVSDDDPSHYFGYAPAILIEKATNGEDADTGTGPQIGSGAPVTWTYVVTNIGNITLANISLSDDIAGVNPVLIASTDANADLLLSVGESWTYEATGVATPGQYQNIGTATGEVPGTVDPNTGNPVQVTDTDPSRYFGGTAMIGILKSVDQRLIDPGTTVTYSYVVSNTGNVPVQNVVVTDDKCAPVEPVLNNGVNTGDVNADAILDLTELWNYTCAVALVVDTINVATAIGEDPLGNPTDPVTDTETVDVLPTAILTKTADPIIVPQSGGTVTFTIQVENTSQEELTLEVLTDSIFDNLHEQGSCAVTQVLAIGGIYTCAFTQVLTGTAGTPHFNVATATLTDDEGNPIQPSDDAQVDFDPPGSIEVSKTPDKTIIQEPTNGQPFVGEDVTFTIVISNTSNNDVVTINTIDDSVFGNVVDRPRTDCTVPQTIALGGTYICTFTELILKTDADGDGNNLVHRNVVTAEGVDEDGNPLTDDDDAIVLIEPVPTPNLDVSKASTLTVDIDGNGVVSPGDTIQYDIVIRNIGGSVATDVLFSDSLNASLIIVAGSVTTSQGDIVTGNGAGEDTVLIEIGDMAPGAAVNVSLQANINMLAICALNVQNQAQVTFGGFGLPVGTGSNSNLNITQLTGTDLALTQSVSTPRVNDNNIQVAGPGDELTYSIVITNPTSLPITNLTMRTNVDSIVASVASISVLDGGSAISADTGYDMTSRTLTAQIDVLQPQQTITVNYVATLQGMFPLDLGFIENSVSLFYDFNSEITGQLEEPNFDRCLVVSTQGVTSLDLIGEPVISEDVILINDGATSEDGIDRSVTPTIYIPLLR